MISSFEGEKRKANESEEEEKKTIHVLTWNLSACKCLFSQNPTELVLLYIILVCGKPAAKHFQSFAVKPEAVASHLVQTINHGL